MRAGARAATGSAATRGAVVLHAPHTHCPARACCCCCSGRCRRPAAGRSSSSSSSAPTLQQLQAQGRLCRASTALGIAEQQQPAAGSEEGAGQRCPGCSSPGRGGCRCARACSCAPVGHCHSAEHCIRGQQSEELCAGGAAAAALPPLPRLCSSRRREQGRLRLQLRLCAGHSEGIRGCRDWQGRPGAQGSGSRQLGLLTGL